LGIAAEGTCGAGDGRGRLGREVAGRKAFLTVLGTENAKSAAFLLKDHAHRIGKTIDCVETSKTTIAVMFKPFTG
jgi:hypothetical protein